LYFFSLQLAKWQNNGEFGYLFEQKLYGKDVKSLLFGQYLTQNVICFYYLMSRIIYLFFYVQLINGLGWLIMDSSKKPSSFQFFPKGQQTIVLQKNVSKNEHII
jgi:hypothetical protein